MQFVNWVITFSLLTLGLDWFLGVLLAFVSLFGFSCGVILHMLVGCLGLFILWL